MRCAEFVEAGRGMSLSGRTEYFQMLEESNSRVFNLQQETAKSLLFSIEVRSSEFIEHHPVSMSK
jgi:hypothetical protein